jgi:UDP:flavonoid glycosyltransferase YjiC (YdhE family)
MRILFAFVGGRGHFEPLVPIARAAAASGHTIVFSCSRSMLPDVEAAGFSAVSTTPPRPNSGGAPVRPPLLPVDTQREERDLRELFVRDAAPRRAAGMLAVARDWRPDVVVCDEVDFGSMIAAERLDIPYASVIVLAAGGMVRPDVVGQALDDVRAENGLQPDPGLAALSRHLVFSAAPPSFRDPAAPLPPTAHPVNTFSPDSSAQPRDRPWPATRPDGPAVYATLGTVFNLESGDLFQRLLEGLRDHPGDVVVTVGGELDPAGLGPQPPNVHIERYLPQSAVLPHVDVVVSHGGSGSVLGALAHGRPMVIIAMGADQPWNAARCAALGVARVLDPIRATPDDIRVAVRAVLEDRTYRLAAEALRDEMRAMPDPSVAVERLEQLVAGRAAQPR